MSAATCDLISWQAIIAYAAIAIAFASMTLTVLTTARMARVRSTAASLRHRHGAAVDRERLIAHFGRDLTPGLNGEVSRVPAAAVAEPQRGIAAAVAVPAPREALIEADGVSAWAPSILELSVVRRTDGSRHCRILVDGAVAHAFDLSVSAARHLAERLTDDASAEGTPS